MTRTVRYARRFAAGTALATLALAGQAPAQTKKAAPQAKPTAKAAKPAKPAATPKLALPDVQRFTLDNGLQVAFLEVHNAPVVTVQLWYHAGSKDEPRDKRGSAHMFEHIMFKGSEHVPPEEHARDINRVGGYVNAQTTEDATLFYETMPSAYMDFALQLEAERMRHLLFRDDMIKTEREVVKEEIREREQSPVQLGLERFLALAFTKHPYAWDPGGRLQDLDATTADDLKKFYDTYYQPNNALVVVVGDETLDDVKASVTKYFGPIAKAPDPPRPADSEQEPPQTEKRREIGDPGQVGLIFMGWHIPAAKDPDIEPLEILQLVLAQGDSSRLVHRIDQIDPKTKKPLAFRVGAQALVREHPGLFGVVCAFHDSAEETVEKALGDEVAQVIAKGITADELRKAKNQIQAGFVFGLENTDGLANQIGESWILYGDPAGFLRETEKIEKVTLDDVKRVAKTYLGADKATILVVPVATDTGGGDK